MGFKQTPQQSSKTSQMKGSRDTQPTPSASMLDIPGNATTKSQLPGKRKKNPAPKGKKQGPGDINLDGGTPAKGLKGSADYKGLMSRLKRGRA